MTEKIEISIEGDEEFAFSAMLINFDEKQDFLSRYRSLIRQLISCISSICRDAQIRDNDWINHLKE